MKKRDTILLIITACLLGIVSLFILISLFVTTFAYQGNEPNDLFSATLMFNSLSSYLPLAVFGFFLMALAIISVKKRPFVVPTMICNALVFLSLMASPITSIFYLASYSGSYPNIGVTYLSTFFMPGLFVIPFVLSIFPAVSYLRNSSRNVALAKATEQLTGKDKALIITGSIVIVVNAIFSFVFPLIRGDVTLNSDIPGGGSYSVILSSLPSLIYNLLVNGGIIACSFFALKRKELIRGVSYYMAYSFVSSLFYGIYITCLYIGSKSGYEPAVILYYVSPILSVVAFVVTLIESKSLPKFCDETIVVPVKDEAVLKGEEGSPVEKPVKAKPTKKKAGKYDFDQILEAKKLYDAGAITEEEFANIKKKLLGD